MQEAGQKIANTFRTFADKPEKEYGEREARVAESEFQYGAEAFEAHQKEAGKAMIKDNTTKNVPVKSGKSR